MPKHTIIPVEDFEKLKRFYTETPHPKLELLEPQFFANDVGKRIYSEWRYEVLGILSSNCPSLGFEKFVRDETHYECERRQRKGQNDIWNRYQTVRDDVLRGLVKCAVDFFSTDNEVNYRSADKRNLRCDLSPWMPK